MSEYNIKVSKLEDGSYKLKINNYSRYEVEEVEALAIKYLQKNLEQKDIKIKELSQWDTNKDTRNSRQRIANNKLQNQLQQKENIIKEVREYIEMHTPSDIGICGNKTKRYYTLGEDSVDHILEILDKGEK